MFQNTKKKCLKNIWKLRNWHCNWQKTLWQIKNMVKLVLQHKQVDHVKSSNVEELHYFFNKIPKSSSQKDENMKSSLPHTCWWHRTFCYMILVIPNKNHNEYQNKTQNLQSSFDFILIVFYSIMVFSVIFDSSLIIENVWYPKFFPQY